MRKNPSSRTTYHGKFKNFKKIIRKIMITKIRRGRTRNEITKTNKIAPLLKDLPEAGSQGPPGPGDRRRP